jgi:nitroreductase
VDDILEVVRWSGSAANRQPWELVVVRDRETLRALAEVKGYASHLAGAPSSDSPA